MPDIQTALKTALDASPLKVRQRTKMEIIWQWLKDHPEKSSSEVAAGVKLPENNVSSLCVQMYTRGMLVRTISYNRHARRDVFHYSTDPHMVEYEAIPRPPKPKLVPIQAGISRVEPVAPVDDGGDPDDEAPEESLDTRVSDLINEMTVREAKAMHHALNRIFGT